MATTFEGDSMTTQFSTKLAALGIALMVNGMMIGAVAYLFSGQIPHAVIAAGPHAPAGNQEQPTA
jgi:hypothetical protein